MYLNQSSAQHFSLRLVTSFGSGGGRGVAGIAAATPMITLATPIVAHPLLQYSSISLKAVLTLIHSALVNK